jgi:hypothetical protein
MRRGELTFDIVDDLVAAHARGRLAGPSGDGFSPARIGPMIELLFEGHDGRSGPLLKSAWLDAATQADLRAALRGSQNLWLDTVQHRGFLRTVFDPLQAKDDLARTQFLMAARKAAETVGFPVPTAQSLAAAVREMESNVHGGDRDCRVSGAGRRLRVRRRRCRRRNSHDLARGAGVQGIIGSRPRPACRVAGRRLALRPVEQPGKRLPRSLSWPGDLNADLRFRSGDHALTITGRADLRQAVLAQKAHFQGFLASVRCRLPASSAATH